MAKTFTYNNMLTNSDCEMNLKTIVSDRSQERMLRIFFAIELGASEETRRYSEHEQRTFVET